MKQSRIRELQRIERYEKILKYLAFSLFFLLGMLSEIGVEMLQVHFENKPTSSFNSSNCFGVNSTLFDNVQCMNAYVKTFYYYNSSNSGKTLDLEQLKTQGGVCEHYALLYADLGNQSGYYVETPVMRMVNDSYHEVAIISNSEGYCVVDQLNYWCVSTR